MRQIKLHFLLANFRAFCFNSVFLGQIAQSVEQRIENPCVGGSIPPLATIYRNDAVIFLSVVFTPNKY